MATPVAQTQAPKGMSLVSFFLASTTVTTFLPTEATRLFSTRSMPSLHAGDVKLGPVVIISLGRCFEWVHAITKQDNTSGLITHALHGAFDNA